MYHCRQGTHPRRVIGTPHGMPGPRSRPSAPVRPARAPMSDRASRDLMRSAAAKASLRRNGSRRASLSPTRARDRPSMGWPSAPLRLKRAARRVGSPLGAARRDAFFRDNPGRAPADAPAAGTPPCAPTEIFEYAFAYVTRALKQLRAWALQQRRTRTAAWGRNRHREVGGGGVWGPEPCTY